MVNGCGQKVDWKWIGVVSESIGSGCLRSDS